MRPLLIFVMLITTVTTLSLAQPGDDLTSWNDQQNLAPSRVIIPAQQRNFEEAYQYLLGSQGKEQDNTQALQLIYQEAERGFLPAQTLLGVLYAQGRVVDSDRSEAIKWLEQAAYRNHPVAQYHLGLLLAQKDQQKEDLIGAYVWWKKAADQGNARAIAALKELDYRLTQDDKTKANTLWEESRKRVVNEPTQIFDRSGSSQQVNTIPAGQIQLTEVVGRWVRNRAAGNLFVISGIATNAFTQTRSNLVVVAKLQGPQGQVLVETTAFCGNPLEDPQLRELPFQQILQAMQNDQGIDQSNLNVQPGQQLPFTVVFKDLPPNISKYTLKARSLPVN